MITWKEFEEFVKRWPIWLSVLLLFIPGLMFKLQRGFPISEYGGSLIIILLMISLYYSLPFLFLGFAYRFIWNSKEEYNAEDLLYITSVGVIGYMITNKVWIELSYKGYNIDFWYIWLFLVAFGIIIVGVKSWIKTQRKK
ncbi:hypothetical protein HYT25_00585 [Candidatus Pacearchaeota archaeon]|nr:hypothetical protein [Candidatus Pacearchaeota archaeon]